MTPLQRARLDVKLSRQALQELIDEGADSAQVTAAVDSLVRAVQGLSAQVLHQLHRDRGGVSPDAFGCAQYLQERIGEDLDGCE